MPLMSSDLREFLYKQAEEDYKSERGEIEEGLERYKSLILTILKVKKWDLPIRIEGSETHFEQYEKDLNLLERSNLVKGQVKYTEHNEYREYKLTEKGSELAKKLLKETRI